MASMDLSKLPLTFDFTKLTRDELSKAPLTWLNSPHDSNVKIIPGVGLKMVPKARTDFWCKTFYSDPIMRSHGHALLYPIPLSVHQWMIESTFSLDAKVLYDQAGIMIFIDDNHWLKGGIEYEADGLPKMSCVVTNTESDWSYQAWSTSESVTVRAICTRYNNICECKFEYKSEAGEWIFHREAPIRLNESSESIRAGVMFCAPQKVEDGEEGMNVVFKYLHIQPFN